MSQDPTDKSELPEDPDRTLDPDATITADSLAQDLRIRPTFPRPSAPTESSGVWAKAAWVRFSWPSRPSPSSGWSP